MEIQVSCPIYKLAHGVNILIFLWDNQLWVKFFKKLWWLSTFVFKKTITCHVGEKMHVIMFDFKNWCGLPSMMGAIDGTHSFERKPSNAFPKDYIYFLKKGYNIVVQDMVNNNKMLIVRVLDYQIMSTIHVYSKKLACTNEHYMLDCLTWV